MEVTKATTLPPQTMIQLVGGQQVAFGQEFVYTINLAGYLVKMTPEEWQDVFDGKEDLPEDPPP